MSFTAATAAGPVAADSLEALCRTRATGSVAWVRHQDLAVAWATASPWLDMHDDSDVLVVLDGRLHNCPAGAPSQVEWLLDRYREFGKDVARGVFGDFVLIVLDRPTRTLLVARDPVGVRPWYTATGGGGAAGASDIATLVGLPWVDSSLNENVAIEYLAGRHQSRGETFYRGVRTLRHGATTVRAAGRTAAFDHHRWQVALELDISWDDAAQRCREVLDESVRSRLDGDGLPTSQLSGGLDSSSVVGTMVGMGASPMLVGRMLFDGPHANERRYSDAVIEHLGLDVLSAPPWLPSEEEARAMMEEFRRPPPDPHFTMFGGLNRELVQLGRRDVLTGAGGDDAFLVMSEAHLLVSAWQLRRPAVLGSIAKTAVRHPRRVWYRMIKPAAHYLRSAPNGSPRPWISDAAADQAQLAELFHRRAARVTGVAAVDERLDGIVSGDVAAALADVALFDDSVGIRHSHPFFDPRVIVATYGLDPWWSTRGGHDRALEVAAFRDRLPPAVAERRWKAEFSEVVWAHHLEESVTRSVLTGPLRDSGWLQTDGFSDIVRQARQGISSAALPLSRCVSLDRWLRAQ